MTSSSGHHILLLLHAPPCSCCCLGRLRMRVLKSWSDCLPHSSVTSGPRSWLPTARGSWSRETGHGYPPPAPRPEDCSRDDDAWWEEAPGSQLTQRPVWSVILCHQNNLRACWTHWWFQKQLEIVLWIFYRILYGIFVIAVILLLV